MSASKGIWLDLHIIATPPNADKKMNKTDSTCDFVRFQRPRIWVPMQNDHAEWPTLKLLGLKIFLILKNDRVSGKVCLCISIQGQHRDRTLVTISFTLFYLQISILFSMYKWKYNRLTQDIWGNGEDVQNSSNSNVCREMLILQH